MDDFGNGGVTEFLDMAIQQHSVRSEARGRAPIFVERTSANVLIVRQRDAAGLTRTFRVEVTAALADVAGRYLTEAA